MLEQSVADVPCPINNAYCTRQPCAYCKHVFCAHMRPERRAWGYYGQYCSPECRDAKHAEIFALGKTRFGASRVVLIVEEEYCYLVLNKRGERPGYGFRILDECAKTEIDKLNLCYCHYPGFSTEDHPVTYAMYPRLAVAMTVEDESRHSMWTIVGFRVLDGEIDTFGVGGHIEVIDRRQTEEEVTAC